ncbi:MAG: discoidin domain-containing protein, partial [Betaproteobacteria bacterium]
MAFVLHLENLAEPAEDDAPGIVDPRGWVSVSGTARRATEVGLDVISMNADDLKLELNLGTDNRSVVDFGGPVEAPPADTGDAESNDAQATAAATGPAPLTVFTGGLTEDGDDESITLDFSGKRGTLIRASGNLTIQVADFFYVTGSLGFEKSTQDLVLADGTEVRVDTLMFGGQDLSAFAGIDGPYWQDTDGDGRITSADEPEADALGLAIGNAQFGLVIGSASPEQADIAGMNWVTAKAAADSVELVGVAGLTLAVRDLALDINLVSGVAAGFDADRKVIDYGAEGFALEVVTGTGKSLAMDAPGEKGQLVRASGAVDLSLGGFVELSGSLAFERARQVVTLTDGTKVQTEMITLGGTDLDGFVGIGPYGDDTDGDGVFEKSEINPDARGFGVRDVEFGVALFKGQGDYADSRWVTATGVVGGVDVMLGLPESLRFDIHSLGLSANLVSHEAPVLSGPAVSLPPALKVDSGTGALDFAAGSFVGSTPDEPVTLTLTPSAGTLTLAGSDLPLSRTATDKVTQTASFALTGSFAVGDVIRIEGIAVSAAIEGEAGGGEPQAFEYTVTEDDLLERDTEGEIIGAAPVTLALRQIAASIREAINNSDDESVQFIASAWFAGVPFDAQGKPIPGAEAPDLGTLIVLQSVEPGTDKGFALAVSAESDEGAVLRVHAEQTLPETLATDKRASDNLSAGIARLVLTGPIWAIDDWLAQHAPLRYAAVAAAATDARLDVSLASGAAEAVAYASITASEGTTADDHPIDHLADDRPDTFWQIEEGEGAGFTVSLDQETVLNGLRLTSVASDKLWQFDPKTYEVYGSNEGEDWESDSWTLVGEGDTGLSNVRGSTSEARFGNAMPFRFYKVVFTETKGSFDGDSYLQLAEARLFQAQGAAWRVESSLHLDGGKALPAGFTAGGIAPVVEALTGKFWIKANAPANLKFDDLTLGLAGSSVTAAQNTLS